MTKHELMQAIDSISDDAEILLNIEGVYYRAASVDTDYEGFCDPAYTIYINGNSAQEGK